MDAVEPVQILSLCYFGRIKCLCLVLFGEDGPLGTDEFGVAGANIGSFDSRHAQILCSRHDVISLHGC